MVALASKRSGLVLVLTLCLPLVKMCAVHRAVSFWYLYNNYIHWNIKTTFVWLLIWCIKLSYLLTYLVTYLVVLALALALKMFTSNQSLRNTHKITKKIPYKNREENKTVCSRWWVQQTSSRLRFLQGAAKSNPLKFFAVFLATVWNFNLKFYSLIN